MTHAYRYAALVFFGLTSSALAGTSYVGLQAETPTVMGTVAAARNLEGGARGSLLVGHAWGMLALEATGSGFDATLDSKTYTGRALGGHLRLSVPLLLIVHAYGDLGVERTWLSGPADYRGNLIKLGAGLEAKIDTVVRATLYLGYVSRRGGLEDGASEVDVSAGTWALGATFGF